MKGQRMLVGAVVVGLLLVLAVGLTQAQEPGPENGTLAESEVGAAMEDIVPIQGRLTDASSNPLTGTYDITFSIYDRATGGTALCTDLDSVQVTEGLFSAELNFCTGDDIDGRQLWLGVKVGSDPEMTPRQGIYAVPYAWSLRPGAVISETRDGILTVRSTGSGDNDAFFADAEGEGEAITAEAVDGIGVYGSSVNNTGVHGFSGSGAGVFGGSLTSIGVTASSLISPAIRAEGTGIIQSTAESYLWISGNGLRPFRQSDSTIIDMDTIGGARIYRGASAGNKNVMLPITIQGPLYGQDVTVSHLTIYWVGDTTFDAISAVLLRRQTGVCSSSDCYVNILYDSTDHGCEDDVYPTGCPLQYDLTSNNELTAGSGILYLTLELAFESSSSWIEIGGVRLALEHD